MQLNGALLQYGIENFPSSTNGAVSEKEFIQFETVLDNTS
jgi:hypothetical protein